MRAYDPKTGLYKDQSIGDTPKIFTIHVDGKPTKVVGVGCKNGGFYVLRADDGKLVKHTPLYTGPPTHPPAKHDPRMLALPSPIGGLQTGLRRPTAGRSSPTASTPCGSARRPARRAPGRCRREDA